MDHLHQGPVAGGTAHDYPISDVRRWCIHSSRCTTSVLTALANGKCSKRLCFLYLFFKQTVFYWAFSSNRRLFLGTFVQTDCFFLDLFVQTDCFFLGPFRRYRVAVYTYRQIFLPSVQFKVNAVCYCCHCCGGKFITGIVDTIGNLSPALLTQCKICRRVTAIYVNLRGKCDRQCEGH